MLLKIQFTFISEINDKMYTGQVIIYKIKLLLGTPINWVTEIKNI